jgi:hypothetical protein
MAAGGGIDMYWTRSRTGGRSKFFRETQMKK